MATYRRFEELPVWQEAARLYHAVLDLLLLPPARGQLSGAFRNQLERAALSVSNNIAEGFERVTVAELLSFLAFARGSAGEVRSMMAVIGTRAEVEPLREGLERVRLLAESCGRQIAGWRASLEAGPVRGARHLSPERREFRERAEAAAEYRRRFLRSLAPAHPLYHTSEAREARGEGEEGIADGR
jgi:four helix bundle protein